MTATRRQAAPPSAPSSLEQYLLLLLSDSNLPTGGFVASSGLESWIQHGNLALTAPDPAPPPSTASPAPPHLPTTSRTRPQPEAALLAFVAHSLHSYARLNIPLLRTAHAAVSSLLASSSSPSSPPAAPPADHARPTPADIDASVEHVLAADALCECMTLNHVARRASTAQGVALLTLYERALAPELPPPGADDSGRGAAAVGEVVARYRAAIRAGQGGGKAVEGGNGHMSVAFAVMTAAVGLGLGASTFFVLPSTLARASADGCGCREGSQTPRSTSSCSSTRGPSSRRPSGSTMSGPTSRTASSCGTSRPSSTVRSLRRPPALPLPLPLLDLRPLDLPRPPSPTGGTTTRPGPPRGATTTGRACRAGR